MHVKVWTLWFPRYRATQRSNTIGGKCSMSWAKINLPVCIVRAPGGFSWGDNGTVLPEIVNISESTFLASPSGGYVCLTHQRWDRPDWAYMIGNIATDY
jgi:hypothetical protein